jgi:hypothetical protein
MIRLVEVSMKTTWVSVLLLLLAAFVCAAQQVGSEKKDPVDLEIRGVLVEVGVFQPISDAEVLYWKMPSAGPKLFTPDRALGKAKTGPDGSFGFAPAQLGEYYVLATKDGYVNANPAMRGLSNSATVTISKEGPVAEARLSYARPSQITGSLLEEESGRPLEKFRVTIQQDYYTRGRRFPIFGGGLGLTDDKGRFVVKVPPGDYLVELLPGITSNAVRFLKEFTTSDLTAVDLDFEQSYWDGGHDQGQALPASVGSNAIMDVGTLKVRRVPFYRVHVSHSAAGCSPNDDAVMNISNIPPSGWNGSADITCGKDILIRGFAPGAYRLDISLRGPSFPPKSRLRGATTFQIVDKNLELFVPLAPGVDIEGKVIAAEGAAKPSFDKMKAYMRATIDVPQADDGPVAVDAKGAFRLVNTNLTEQNLFISGVPGGYYIQEVRYNGSPVRGNLAWLTFELDGSAPSHSLEIVLDDKPAFVTGTVTDRDRPVSQPLVVLARWPLPNVKALWPLTTATGDAGGKYQFTGLAPGEYRILAVSSTLKDKLEKPDVLEPLLRTAKKIELGPRATQNLTLELTELR